MHRVPEYSDQSVCVSSAMSEGHKAICKAFASGTGCKFGKHCRYLHFRPPTNKLYYSSRNKDEAVTRDNTVEDSSSLYRSRTQHNHTTENGSLDQASHQSPLLHSSETEVSDRKNEVRKKPEYRKKPSRFIPDRRQRVPNDEPRRKKVCYTYSTSGICRFGDRCRFLHEPEVSHRKCFTNTNYNEGRKINHLNTEDREKAESHDDEIVPEKKICSFYKRGSCKYGRNCKWLHADTNVVGRANKELAALDTITQDLSKSLPCKPVGSKTVFELELMTEDIASQHRRTEVNLFSKRYPKAVKADLEKGDSYEFVFSPTDPDWPYDVKNVAMVVLFPKDYPVNHMVVTVPEDQPLPNTLRRYVWKSIEEWIIQRNENLQKSQKVELMFRPFIRWLDRALEDLFTTGLKLYQKELIAQASGIELVPASQLQEEYQKAASDSDDRSNSQDHSDDQISEDDNGESDNEYDEVTTENELKGLDPAKTGTEVKLHNLQLKENTATLTVRKVQLILQCERCKNKETLVTPTERLNATKCAKCFEEQLVNFRASIVHQFSNVMGYVDLKGCIIFDLILAECDFIAGCLNCNKDVSFGNITPGQPKDTWCHGCHAKLRVAADCAKFLQLQPSVMSDNGKLHNAGLKKVRKPPKDPAIQPGSPLPENGTCKHYKKSFRWLRFPCCGKAYPCDVCHESNEDHEMKFASRMICGYCATEQPYAGDRPCKACNAYVVKKFTEHWEGGKGCRDKIKMSRTDERKYANQNKTISRKAQSKQTSGKKNIKIRHS